MTALDLPLPATTARPADPPVSLAAVAALLAGLNGPQRRAVTHADGPLLVVAGPGTGKTRVISRRIAWLIATKRARPAEILALTFTERAASEMQARVDVLVPYGHNDSAIHTFHAFGDRLVREHAFRLGLPDDPRLVTRAEAVVLLREHLFELGLDHFRPLGDPTRFLGALAALFGRAKEEGIEPGAYAAHAADLLRAAEAVGTGPAGEAARAEADVQAELARAYGAYQALLGGRGRLDFGDQVLLALRLLREAPDVRAAVQRRFRYILVDEFQDTDGAQLELLTLLAGPHGNVTAVGDDDQSIYRFRGAALGNVLGFAERFTGARTIVLRRNHRSRRPILEAAYRLIRHNDPARLEARIGLDKRPVAVRRARAGAVECHAFGRVEEEADWIAGQVAERLARGGRPRDIGILVRTNADARPILESLDVLGVPRRFSGADGLYAQPEIRELLAFLRTVADPSRSVDLYAVATGSAYGLGGSDMTRLLDTVRRERRSLWDAVQLAIDERAPGLSADGRRRLARLVGDVRHAIELAHRRPAPEVLYDHLKRSGRLASLAADGAGAARRLENVGRFFRFLRGYAEVVEDPRLSCLAPHLEALVAAGEDPGLGEADDDVEAVSVLTVHKAKGLEFGIVFVAGLADGRFPSRGRRGLIELPDGLRRTGVEPGSEADEPALAEERRLAYVAMTRARDRLVLTYAARAGTSRPRRPSPFLIEALDGPPPMPDTGLRLVAIEAPVTVPVPAALPWTSPRGLLDLSFSQVDSYLTCPRQYEFRHRLRLPTPAHHALSYGSALHAVVAAYHQQERRGTLPSEADLLASLKAAWSPEGYLSREHEEARFAAATAALARFRAERLASAALPPAAVEEPFSVVIDETRIRGRFDRVDDTPEGTVITDYKSGDVRDPVRARERARTSLQLSVYALAFDAIHAARPSRLQLHFLDTGLVGQAAVTDARLDAARERIATAAAGIRAGAFEATPGPVACAYCPFRDVCPASASRGWAAR